MKDYKNYYEIKAAPEIVYQALTQPATIRLWSGHPAEMSTEAGSEFSLFGGDITGRNLEFEENRKIVQQWYFEGEDEPSVVTIKLHPHKKGTSAELLHENIPDEVYDEFSAGWDEKYFGMLQDFYEE